MQKLRAYAPAAFLCAALAIDIVTPLGIADWWAYALAIVASLLRPDRTAPIRTAVAAAFFTVLGGALSPEGDALHGWTNRVLGVLLCALLGALCGWLAKKREEIEIASEQLRTVIEEREEIRRDLHDGILQELYALGLGLEATRAQVSNDPQAASTMIERTVVGLNGVIRGLRSIITGDAEALAIHGDDVESALAVLVQRLGASSRLVVDRDATRALERRQARELLLIAAEAISNTRHAGAKSTEVTLSISDGAIALVVKDDGTGFAPDRVASSGHGLRNMKRRAQRLRASFDLTSNPGSGTIVTITIPKEARSG